MNHPQIVKKLEKALSEVRDVKADMLKREGDVKHLISAETALVRALQVLSA